MIFNEDQQVKLKGVVLPGVIKSMEIKSAAKIDEQEVEGSAAKPKQATGYEDAKITIELILDDTETQTKYQRFSVIQTIFRAVGQAVPQPIPIICEDTAARGITTVLFKDLVHKKESKRDQLAVTLELWEHVPQTIKTQKSSSGGKAASGTGAGSLSPEYKDYLGSDRWKGSTSDTKNSKAAKSGVYTTPAPKASKLNKSPARDTADSAKHMTKIKKR